MRLAARPLRPARSMMLAGLALLTGVVPTAAQDSVPFRAGMLITQSTRITPGTYEVAGAVSLDSALITVRGSAIDLDMTGVILRGIPIESDPDRARGVAVLIDGGSDVTLRGGVIRGYRFGVLARGTRGLRLFDNDLSYSWKPRLFSLVGHESLLDWMSTTPPARWSGN